MNNKPSIILASQSPRRKEILENAGFDVLVIIPHNAHEISLGDSIFDSPSKVVLENARRKASSIGKKNKPVLASDTIVILNNKQYGKPKDLSEATEFLSELSGKTHQVFSSFCLSHDSKMSLGFDVSDVTFKHLKRNNISHYLNTVHTLDKAGAYAIQDGGEIIIQNLTGSFHTVMGLPVEKVMKVIEKMDIYR